MNSLKRVAKALIGLTPYRIGRARDLNRFQAIPEGLSLIARFGFEPTQIIDGGANVGDFAIMARARFPQAHIHMIEPQPACAESLLRLTRNHGFSFHPAALVGPEQSGGAIGFVVTPGSVTTGAHIGDGSEDPSAERINVEARSLDDLLAAKVGKADRLLLKLDLEGREFDALKGAQRVLQWTEVVLTESAFFGDTGFTNGPLQLSAILAEHGFVLYDVLSISGRSRDQRARQCDLLFVKANSALVADGRWN